MANITWPKGLCGPRMQRYGNNKTDLEGISLGPESRQPDYRLLSSAMRRIFGRPAEENMDNSLLHLALVLSLIFCNLTSIRSSPDEVKSWHIRMVHDTYKSMWMHVRRASPERDLRNDGTEQRS